MEISRDYRDLFIVLNRYRVRYLLVGAYAMAYYAEPRFTKDIDIWVYADAKNAVCLYKALGVFGAPLKDITVKDFQNRKMIYQIGVAPVRIDILMGLPGIGFETAWKNRKRAKYGKVPINLIGLKDLLRSKKKAKRKNDILDMKRLKRAIAKRSH